MKLIQDAKNYARRIVSVWRCYGYDGARFLKYSMMSGAEKSQERMLGVISARYHVVEKGLTIPSMRPGFGKENLTELLKLCTDYQLRYDKDHVHYQQAVKVILEYEAVHRDLNFTLDECIVNEINRVKKNNLGVIRSFQKEISRDEYFSSAEGLFYDLANGRHSVRNFDGEVDLQLLKDAIELAQTAPSACNRQPVRIHIVQKNKIDALLELHMGTRGFGHLADKLLLVSVDLSSYLCIEERNSAFLDGGIYAMNLLYSLHYYKIAACTLNWSVSPKIDKEVRKVLDISDTESIACLIAVGGVPDNFKLAQSPRLKTNNIIKVH